MTLRELRQRRGAWWLVLGLGAGLPFARIACSVLGLEELTYPDDEIRYYLPAIRQIAERWPALSLSEDALSAVSPGYLYLLAGLGKWAGLDSTTLRLANWLAAVGVLIVLLRMLLPQCPPWRAALLMLPFCVSNFFLKSASWVVTDNAGLLLTLAALSTAWKPADTSLRSLAAGLLAAGAVFARQLQIWVCLPVAVARALLARSRGPRWMLLQFALAALPALAVLGWLLLSWRGLVPPNWAGQTLGFSTVGPIYFLSVVGCFGPFYWLSVRTEEDSRRTEVRWLLGGALAALGFWAVSPSSIDGASGRWGGYLWTLAYWSPTPGDRAVSFLILAVLGSSVMVLLGRALWRRGETRWLWMLAAALLAFALTCLPNRNIFHRYYEPPALVFLALACAPLARSQFRILPLLLIAVAQFAWSLFLLFLYPLYV